MIFVIILKPASHEPTSLHCSTAPSSLRRRLACGALTHIREFLAFKIANEEYGVDILRVQEIRSYEKPTTIANAPEHLKGVVNLRGVIVPIIDLRIKLGVSEVQYDHLTVVIVLNIGQRVVGVVVDGRVGRAHAGAIAAAPRARAATPTSTPSTSWPLARWTNACSSCWTSKSSSSDTALGEATVAAH